MYKTPEQNNNRKMQLYAHTLKKGLQNGLSNFFGRAVRVALIYSINKQSSDSFFVYDTTKLLDNCKANIWSYFHPDLSIASQTNDKRTIDSSTLQPIINNDLLYYCDQNEQLYYQAWFIEKISESSPQSIVKQWTNFAQALFRNLSQENTLQFYGVGERVIEHSAYDVIREVIITELARTYPQHLVEKILNSLLEIASVKEEGKACNGILAFELTKPQCQDQLNILLTTPINIKNYKHIRKLLTLSSDNNYLVAVTIQTSGVEVIGLFNKINILQY